MKAPRLFVSLLLCLSLCLALTPAAFAAGPASPPVITRQPTDVTVVDGRIAKLTLTATGKELKYQWQSEIDGVWLNSSGAGADKPALSFKADAELDGSAYRCVVSNEGGSVTSEVVTVKVIQLPRITLQPVNADILEDDVAVFFLEAEGTDLQYRWQTVRGGKWADMDDASARTPVIEIPGTAETRGSKYRCVVSNEGGSVTSAVVMLSVKLRDEEVLEQVQALTYAKSYEEAIETCEDYFDGVPMDKRDPKLVAACVHAYVMQAGNLQWDSQNEAAEALLIRCCETYAGTAAVKEAEKSLKTLQLSLKRNEPLNGTLFTASARGGYGELVVKAGDQPALVKAVNLENPDKYVTLYVRPNESASVRLVDGSYELRYATGARWFSRDELFGSATRYAKADELIEFETTRSGNSVYYSTVTVTLQSPQNGNLSVSALDPEEF